MNAGHGRFILRRYDSSADLLGAYQLHTTHPPEGVDLYIRDILRESARADIPVKLLVDKDGFVLRAEIYHEYLDESKTRRNRPRSTPKQIASQVGGVSPTHLCFFFDQSSKNESSLD